MNIKDYIITINNLKYCKDLIGDRLLLIDSIENVTNIPSDKKDKTLYILDNSVHYYSNFEISQVELEKQEVKVVKSVVKETTEKVEKFKKLNK